MKMHVRTTLVVLALLVVGCSQIDAQTDRPTKQGAPLMTGNLNTPSGDIPGTGPHTPRPSFADLPDHGDLAAYPGKTMRREGAYTWYRADLSEEHALRAIVRGRLHLTTPDGRSLDFHYDRHVEHPSGDWTWIGHLVGHEGQQAILTFGATAAFGSIAQPDKRPLRFVIRDGASWLVETDASKLAGIIGKVTDKPDFMVVPKPRTGGGGATGLYPGVGAMFPAILASGAPMAAAASPGPVIDVVLGYTPGFAADNGGNAGATTRLNFLVDFTNAAYVKSQLNGRIRLVAAMPVSYTETDSNEDALEKMSGYVSGTGETTPDPAFDALRAARETLGADLVSLVRKFHTPQNDGCGIAWLLGGAKQGFEPNDGWDYLGYSVVSDGIDVDEGDNKSYYCEDHTLAHELGHNMGLAHDRATAKGDDGVLDDPDDFGVSDYSFGYKTGIGSSGFYTVMAYGDIGQASNSIFSNPRVAICGAYENQVCGIDNEADASRSLSETMPTIATFRAVGADGYRRNDVNADARSDLLFHNAATRQFSYRLMDGTTTTDSALINGVGSGYSVAATGDFNGDGRADIVWTSAALDLYVWLGNGTGFSSTKAGTYPSGWKVVGASDVDGDGKSDLLFHNAATRQFSYRIMNGVATVRSALIGGVGAGYSVAATGDFNGDGRADIVWTSAALDLYVWLGNGTGFGSAPAGTYSSGWALIR
jgi:hypothetical protein